MLDKKFPSPYGVKSFEIDLGRMGNHSPGLVLSAPTAYFRPLTGLSHLKSLCPRSLVPSGL
jgi:hypothetical protein